LILFLVVIVWFGNGITYDTSGTYSDTLLNIYGCDSIVNIDLNIYYSSYSIDSLTSCDSLVWNGRIFYSSGIYDTTLVNVAGCDSFAQLYLTILLQFIILFLIVPVVTIYLMEFILIVLVFIMILSLQVAAVIVL